MISWCARCRFPGWLKISLSRCSWSCRNFRYSPDFRCACTAFGQPLAQRFAISTANGGILLIADSTLRGYRLGRYRLISMGDSLRLCWRRFNWRRLCCGWGRHDRGKGPQLRHAGIWGDLRGWRERLLGFLRDHLGVRWAFRNYHGLPCHVDRRPSIGVRDRYFVRRLGSLYYLLGWRRQACWGLRRRSLSAHRHVLTLATAAIRRLRVPAIPRIDAFARC